jgi:hypothetical protein
LVLGLSGLGVFYYYRASADRELAEVVADLDRTNPGWRLDDVLARRQPIPDDQNSVSILLAAHQHFPKKTWYPKIEENLDCPPPVLLRPEVAAALEAELKPMAAALAKARELEKYPKGRFSVVYSTDFVSTSIAKLDIRKTREVGKLLQLSCWANIQKGDIEGSCVDCRALLNTARSIGDEPMFAAQLVRTALDSITIASVERLLAQGELGDPLLAQMQKGLQDEAKEPLFHYGLVGELGGMDRYFTAIETGQVDMEQLKEGIAIVKAMAFMNSPDPNPGIEERVQEHFPAPMIKRSHACTLRKLSEVMEAAKLKGYEKIKAIKKLEKSFGNEKAQGLIPILAEYLSPVYKIAEAEWRIHSQLSCAMAGLAAERFRISNKRWPKSLDELVKARLLKEVPIDLFTGRSLGFRTTNDSLVVYSVGAKGTYDGKALDNLHAIDPTVHRIEFRLWNVDWRRQPPWPEQPKIIPDGPGFGK